MASQKVAVVTGSNKGIGFAIVRGLCKSFDGAVYLTARDVGRGTEAVAALEKEGLKPRFHQLDISDTASVTALKDHLVGKYGGLDLLVNNAAIAYKQAAPEPFAEQAEVSVRINFLDTVNVCDILFPILRPHARVVHVSSRASSNSLAKCSAEMKQRFLNTKSIQEIKDIVKEFVEAAKAGTHQQKGWANSAYGASKMCVTQMAVIQQKLMDTDPREDIVVNSCCPGHWVVTDMSSNKGTSTADQGADTPLYLAMLPPKVSSPRGNFVAERKILPWK